MANKEAKGAAKYVTGDSIYRLDKDKVKTDWMGMPSDDIDPEKKNGPWALAWARYTYAMFYNNQCYTTYDKLREYRLLRLYGAGEQPAEFYMDRLGVKEVRGVRKGMYNVDWKIWSPAPKYKRLIIGRLEGQDHRINAHAIDPLSGAEREDMKWRSWVKAMFGEKQRQMEQALGVMQEPGPEYVPESLDELELYSQLGGFKLGSEIDIEKGLDYTDFISDFKQIKRKLLGDFIDINIAAYRDYYDKATKKIKYKYIDPEFAVFDWSKEEDFKNMRFWGYQELMSIKQIREQSNYTEDQLKGFALTYCERFGNLPANYIENYAMNGYRNKDGIYVYDYYKVPVWISEWKSMDKKYKTKRKTKMGEVYYPESYGKVYNTDKKQTEVTEAQNVYSTCWVIGSDMVFNDGPLEVLPRVAETKEARMSAHVYALPGKSIMRSIMHNLDQLQLTKLKLENALAQAPPNGIKVEFGALNNIDLGDGDKKPLELIRMYRSTGDIVYKATTMQGRHNQYSNPIEPLTGGIGPFLNECITLFEMNFQFISEMSGIDRISAVSQKPGETTATEVKNSIASTTDSLQPLYAGYLYLKESGARNAVYRIQTVVKYVPEAYDVYYPVMGRATLEHLRLTRNITAAEYGIKIEALPSQEEKMAVLQAAQEALKPGKDGEQISFGEYLLIVQMVGRGQVKQAIAVLTFRLNKRKAEAQELQAQNMRMNSETMIKQEEAKRATEIAKITAKAEEDRKTELLKAFITKDFNDNQQMNELQKMVIEAYLSQKTEAPAAASQPEPVAA